MLRTLLCRKTVVFSLLLGLTLFIRMPMSTAANAAGQNDNDTEVLTRGPLHEAFADVSVDKSSPGLVAPRSVPDPINEIPPDYKPEGENVEWIPGYWSWDDEREDFIWVSGVWRDIPPGHQWIPGYWTAVEGGSQYISGYWTLSEQTATEYLPPPPEPLEAAPSSPPPADQIWMDGTWVWYNNHYVWQSGYWYEPRPDMIWIPAHYIWTPRGYIFVRGYWDYQFARRGVMFAPLYYSHPVYRYPRYAYTPHIVLNFDAVMFSLFIRSNSHCYYFGDYYDRHYERRGFRPWYSNHATRYGYDPFYRSYRWHQLRHDRDWEKNYHRQFEYRRDHREARPPRIFVRQEERHYQQGHGPAERPIMGRQLSEVVTGRDQPMRFRRLQPDHKWQLEARDKKINEFQRERRKLEVVPDHKGRPSFPSERDKPVSLHMPASPIKTAPGRSSVFSGKQAEPERRLQTDSGKNRFMRPQIQPQNQPRPEPQKKLFTKPQVQPHEQSPPRSPKTPFGRPQAQPQKEYQQQYKERQQERHQTRPQENRLFRTQPETPGQAQAAPPQAVQPRRLLQKPAARLETEHKVNRQENKQVEYRERSEDLPQVEDQQRRGGAFHTENRKQMRQDFDHR